MTVDKCAKFCEDDPSCTDFTYGLDQDAWKRYGIRMNACHSVGCSQKKEYEEGVNLYRLKPAECDLTESVNNGEKPLYEVKRGLTMNTHLNHCISGKTGEDKAKVCMNFSEMAACGVQASAGTSGRYTGTTGECRYPDKQNFDSFDSMSNVYDIKRCKDKCDNEKECDAFDYNKNRKFCSFFSNKNGKTHTGNGSKGNIVTCYLKQTATKAKSEYASIGAQCKFEMDAGIGTSMQLGKHVAIAANLHASVTAEAEAHAVCRKESAIKGDTVHACSAELGFKAIAEADASTSLETHAGIMKTKTTVTATVKEGAEGHAGATVSDHGMQFGAGVFAGASASAGIGQDVSMDGWGDLHCNVSASGGESVKACVSGGFLCGGFNEKAEECNLGTEGCEYKCCGGGGACGNVGVGVAGNCKVCMNTKKIYGAAQEIAKAAKAAGKFAREEEEKMEDLIATSYEKTAQNIHELLKKGYSLPNPSEKAAINKWQKLIMEGEIGSTEMDDATIDVAEEELDKDVPVLKPLTDKAADFEKAWVDFWHM